MNKKTSRLNSAHIITAHLFDNIKYIKKNADKQIHDLTLKELYNIILKKNVLHDSEGNKLPLHGERTMGWIDWEMTWRMLRTRGIPPKVSSTMWKILYNILPTNEKLDRIKNGVNKGVCTLCPNKIDNIYHSLTECINSKNAAELLLKIIKYLHNPAIMYDIVYLQYNTNNILDLPITWIVTTGFHLIWKNKLNGGISDKKLLAELMARNRVLLNTKYIWEQ